MEFFFLHPILTILGVIIVLLALRLVGIGKGLITWIGAGVIIILAVIAGRSMV